MTKFLSLHLKNCNKGCKSATMKREKYETSVEPRISTSFGTFKSNVCHLVKDYGDLDFLVFVLENDIIRKYWNAPYYAESLYLLAMVDYLSRENDVPLCAEYNDLRKAELTEVLYPAGILILDALNAGFLPLLCGFGSTEFCLLYSAHILVTLLLLIRNQCAISSSFSPLIL